MYVYFEFRKNMLALQYTFGTILEILCQNIAHLSAEARRNLSDFCGKYYVEVISGPDRGLFYLTTLQLAHLVSQGQRVSVGDH